MPELTETDYKALINTYVSAQLKEYKPKLISTPKVIHDSVHGTNIFYPHEIAFLDLPIIQRLRRISQTDVASYVFPAGNHNRFEHTIGVTAISGQMVEAIFSKQNNPLSEDIDKSFIFNNCRIAAILHDCGHGPFSHLSEQVYEKSLDTIKQKNVVLQGASAHEILSYYITTSEPLKEFNDTIIKGKYNINIDLDFIGEIIVGYIDRKQKSALAFAVEIINGAFDADKLDYILRDSHSTGIRMALDLPRLMYTLDVIKDEQGLNRLAIDISGVSALEEIVFNKMMLTSALYHHHKVRAAGCILKDIFRSSDKFNVPVDYLYYTDDQIFNIDNTSKITIKNLSMLKNRNIPKRAFCFSSRTLKNVSDLQKIMAVLEEDEKRQAIIDNISSYIRNNLNSDVPNYEIWIDSPKNPKFKEATQCIIKSEGSENNYLLLRNVFPTDDWVRAFSENKWQGFVYTLPENCEVVSAASKYVFENVFEIEFNDLSNKLCKIR